VLADFENGYAGWRSEGDAFGDAPASGMLPGQQPVSGFRGRGLVNSFRGGDRAQGTLTSPPFDITASYISFLIGGGAHAETRVDLRVDGKVVRTAKGREREQLAWQSWEVRELRGKRADIQVVDKHSGGWGHINLDHILLADEPARPATATALWADYGPDFYAGVSWSDVPQADGRRLWLGWMSNWQYAGKVPTDPWRSAMSIPRELTLRRTPAGLRLVQQPVAEALKLREAGPRKFPGGTFDAAAKWLQNQQNLPPLLDLELMFTNITAKSAFTLQVHTGPDEATSLVFNGIRARLAVDRTRSGKTDFHPKFPARHEAPLPITDGRVTLRLLVDTSSLEVFAQSGETVLTELIFPTAGPRSLSLTNDGEAPGVGGITIHAVK
jgi:sucrose-6-phosphate hydrolase SacC (GH32 family)